MTTDSTAVTTIRQNGPLHLSLYQIQYIVAFVKSFSVQIFFTYGSVSLCPGYLSISLKATRIILQRNVLSHSENGANGREQWFQMSVSKKSLCLGINC